MIVKGDHIEKIRFVDPHKPGESICLLFKCCAFLGVEGDIDPALLIPADQDHFCKSEQLSLSNSQVSTLSPPMGAKKAIVQILAASPETISAQRASRLAISTRDGSDPDITIRNGNEHAHFSSFCLSKNEMALFQIKSISPSPLGQYDKAVINYYI